MVFIHIKHTLKTIQYKRKHIYSSIHINHIRVCLKENGTGDQRWRGKLIKQEPNLVQAINVNVPWNEKYD